MFLTVEENPESFECKSRRNSLFYDISKNVRFVVAKAVYDSFLKNSKQKYFF